MPLLKRRRFFIPSFLVALIFFVVSYYLTVYNITGKSIVSYSQMNGFWYTLASMLFNLLIAFFFGLYILLFIFKRNLKVARNKSPSRIGLSAGGLLGGILSAGCPTCGAPLFALLGAPLALFSLPFKGLEIKVLSIAFLLLAIHFLTKNIYKNISAPCLIKLL